MGGSLKNKNRNLQELNYKIFPMAAMFINVDQHSDTFNT